MTRLRVEHVTSYEYASRVELGAHMVHLRPRALGWQQVREFALRAAPEPDQVRWGVDAFGNDVGWLFLDRSHGSFEVRTEAVVDVTRRAVPEAGATPGWEAVVAAARRDGAAEFVFASPKAASEGAVVAYAGESFMPGRPVLEGLLELMGRIQREFRFDAGVTTVSTPVGRVMQLRAGVCQDFAHLMIAGLRGLGLPARYVSGYLRTFPPPGEERRRGADASHAWVGCWLGPGLGWIDLDPTNDLVVQDEHVWLGWGRDYADVSPIRGMLLGGGAHTLRVSVDIEPVGDEVIA